MANPRGQWLEMSRTPESPLTPDPAYQGAHVTAASDAIYCPAVYASRLPVGEQILTS